MIYEINKFFLSYIFNSDPSGLSEDDIRAVDEFQAREGVDLSRFSVVCDEYDEFLHEFGRCDITGRMSDIVFLCDTQEDVDAVLERAYGSLEEFDILCTANNP